MTQTVVEGQWTFTYANYRWSATHTDGTVVAPPVADTVSDVRRVIAQSAQAYTVVSGPGRAISARRYTNQYFQ